MGEAAVAAARAVNYVGAGTVEFLLRGRHVLLHRDEHASAGRASGHGNDHRARSGRVAAARCSGRSDCRARRTQLRDAVMRSKHASMPKIRSASFLPAIGRLKHLRPPPEMRTCASIRACRSGDEISVYYDPMIAKLIVWDDDRAAALRRLRRALEQYEVAGVTTNISFLAAIAAHPAFRRRRDRHRIHRAPSRPSWRCQPHAGAGRSDLHSLRSPSCCDVMPKRISGPRVIRTRPGTRSAAGVSMPTINTN